MSHSNQTHDLLSEIDALQDEVLRQLDELNVRIERVLAEFGGAADRPASTMVAETKAA